MHFLRRAALRALSTRTVSPLLSNAPRTFVTFPTPAWKPQPQWTLSRFQKRFLADESTEAKAADVEATDETVPEKPTEGGPSLAQEATSAAEASESAVEEPIADEAKAAAVEPEATSESVQSFDPAAAAGAAAGAAATSTSAERPIRRPFGEPEHEIPKSTVLYVGNLFFESTEDDLRRFFDSAGAIDTVKIVYDHRGLSKGFGYVTFKNMEDAARAIELRNQEVFQGRRITVQYHRQRPRSTLTQSRNPNPPSKTLFIGNMSFEMSDRDLNDLFREIRNVLDVRVAIDRRSGQPRGFAHADFIDIPSATKAMEILRNKEIYGRRLRVDYSMSSAMSRPQ